MERLALFVLLMFLVAIVIGQWIALFAAIWFLLHFQLSAGFALLIIAWLMSLLHKAFKQHRKLKHRSKIRFA